MDAADNADAVAAKWRQLATITARLTELHARSDMLISAFKFEAARALYARIEAAEREHRELAAELPPPPASKAPPTPYQVAGRGRRR